MKTLLLSIACLLLGSVTVSAQTINDFGPNHYKETKTFVMDGYTYQCEVNPAQLVLLYNQKNKWNWLTSDNIYRDTGKYFAGLPNGSANTIVDNLQMTRKAYEIVDNAFTQEMVKQFGDREVGIVMYLYPESGKVEGVSFDFTTFSPYVKVPIRIFRSIETQLKSQISFTPTSEGKRLNYIMLGWSQLPKDKRILPKPPTIDPPQPTLPSKTTPKR